MSYNTAWQVAHVSYVLVTIHIIITTTTTEVLSKNCQVIRFITFVLYEKMLLEN